MKLGYRPKNEPHTAEELDERISNLIVQGANVPTYLASEKCKEIRHYSSLFHVMTGKAYEPREEHQENFRVLTQSPMERSLEK